MKNILYLFVFVLSFASCTKNEDQANLEFVQVKFRRETSYPVFVKYDGIKNNLNKDYVAVPLGEQKFEIYNAATGDKVIDTVLNVTGPVTYYVYIPTGATIPILVTELPPPPPPPAGPLDDVTAAPDGFMKIKMLNASQVVTGNIPIDVEILSTVNTAGVYDLVATVPGVTATYGNEFFMCPRPVRGATKQTNFKFRFLRSDTKEPIRTAQGQVFVTAGALTMGVRPLNAFALTINYMETEDMTGIERDGKKYSLRVTLNASK
jgi:hypothetical protein